MEAHFRGIQTSADFNDAADDLLAALRPLDDVARQGVEAHLRGAPYLLQDLLVGLLGLEQPFVVLGHINHILQDADHEIGSTSVILGENDLFVCAIRSASVMDDNGGSDSVFRTLHHRHRRRHCHYSRRHMMMTV